MSFDVDGSGKLAAVEIGFASGERLPTTIELVDLNTSTVVTKFELAGGGESLGALRMSSDGQTVWVTAPGSRTIAAIDTSSQAITRQESAPDSIIGPGATAAFSQSSPFAWVSNPLTGDISELDLSNQTVVNTFSVLSPPPPGNSTTGMGLVLSPDEATLWVTDLTTRELVGVDPETGAEKGIISVPGLLNEGVAMGDGTAAVVSQDGANDFSIVPVNLTTKSASAAIASFSDGLIKLPSHETGNTVWVLDISKGELIPIDLTTGGLGAPIQVSTSPTPPPSTLNAGPPPLTQLLTCDLSNPNLSQAAQLFENAAGSGGNVGYGGWCGRYGNSDTWIWIAPGSADNQDSGFVATYTCAPTDSACLDMSAPLPASGWTIHDPPQPGTIYVLATEAMHNPAGTTVVFLASTPFATGIAKLYWFDPLKLVYEQTTNGDEVAQPAPIPASILPTEP